YYRDDSRAEERLLAPVDDEELPYLRPRGVGQLLVANVDRKADPVEELVLVVRIDAQHLRDLVVGEITPLRAPQDMIDVAVLDLTRAFRQRPVADDQVIGHGLGVAELWKVGNAQVVDDRRPDALEILLR